MRRFLSVVLGMQIALLGAGNSAHAETAGAGVEARPESSVGAVLGSMSSRAAVVFVGQVVRIERPANGGVVEVAFRVDRAVLGQVGSMYTLREWAGLWVAGQQRYRVGQRAMVFLHAANEAGFSSPVGGMEGVVPMVPMGEDAEPLLDVRWLAARVVRSVGEPIADAEGGAIALSEAIQAVVQGGRGEPVREPVEQPLPVGIRPVAAPVAIPVAGVAVVSKEMSSRGDLHDIR
jgi:hypothetical protein